MLRHMQLFSSDAIVLRHVDYGEADRIVTCFTRDFGLLKGFARGARKSVKRFGPALEPLAEVQLFWDEGRGGLPSLKEAELVDLHGGLRGSLPVLALAGYGCELIEALFGEGEPFPQVFDLLRAFLAHLNAGGDPVAGRFLLELRALHLAGYIPHFLHCAECGGPLPERFGFDARRGGSLCPGCGSGAGVEVGLLTIGSLARSLLTPVERFEGFRFSDTTLAEGRQVLADALAGHLLRPLKSLVFLERFDTIKTG